MCKSVAHSSTWLAAIVFILHHLRPEIFGRRRDHFNLWVPLEKLHSFYLSIASESEVFQISEPEKHKFKEIHLLCVLENF
jgi:hypothetical protein